MGAAELGQWGATGNKKLMKWRPHPTTLIHVNGNDIQKEVDHKTCIVSCMKQWVSEVQARGTAQSMIQIVKGGKKELNKGGKQTQVR